MRRPSLRSQIQSPNPAPQALPEDGLLAAGAWRTWSGVAVGCESWIHNPGPSLHAFENGEKMLLVTALSEQGGLTAPRIKPEIPYYKAPQSKAINFVCAGMPLWGHSDSVTFVRTSMLLFDRHTVERTLGEELDVARLQMPQLCHQDENMFTLLALLADAVTDQEDTSSVYGEGLICSIFSLLLGKQRSYTKSGHSVALTTWQVERIKDYIYSRLHERVEIEELAKLLDLSPAHFSRAFKKTVGWAPYRFQLEARITHAQHLIRDTYTSIDEAAHRTGFVDRAHFNRVFRKLTGETPGSWRKGLRSYVS